MIIHCKYRPVKKSLKKPIVIATEEEEEVIDVEVKPKVVTKKITAKPIAKISKNKELEDTDTDNEEETTKPKTKKSPIIPDDDVDELKVRKQEKQAKKQANYSIKQQMSRFAKGEIVDLQVSDSENDHDDN